MIKIFIRYNELYVQKDNKIYKYEFKELELDIEEIIDELNFNTGEKFILILDITISDYEYYIKIFKAYKLKIYRIYLLKEILLENFSECICVSHDKSIYISNEKEEIMNFTADDNIDLTGLKVINLPEQLEYIFSISESTNAKNYMRINILKNEYILICLVVFILLNYLIASKIFIDNELSSNIEITYKKIEILERELEEKKLNLKNLSEIKIEESFYEELKKHEIERIVEYLLKLSNKGIQYYEISLLNNKITLEGVCDNMEILNKNIKDFEIENLKLKNQKLYFKISYNLDKYD
ncbi:hypothetical protein [Oceanivirga salmonicida]|uniref:hypothetical protein n=1 Tax=Oceanivirga salmonicida TaxID=1769291 RepID=UPI0008365C12|nr:hypothetical protein [Oceanivirga salmonicida]